MAYTEACACDAFSFRVTRKLAGGQTFVVLFELTRAVTTRSAANVCLKIVFGRTDEHAPRADCLRTLDEYHTVLWLYTFDDFARTEVVHWDFKHYTVEPLRSAPALAHSFDNQHLLEAASWIRRRLDETI